MIDVMVRPKVDSFTVRAQRASALAFRATIFLLAMCTRGSAFTNNSVRKEGAIRLFVPGETNVTRRMGDEIFTRNIYSFELPFLVGADGALVAFARTKYAECGNANVDIVAKYIETGEKHWVNKVTANDGSNWKTQLVVQSEEGLDTRYTYALGNSLVVAKGNKIYLFTVRFNATKGKLGKWEHPDDWNFEMTVGEIKLMNGAQTPGKTIVWKAPNLTLSILTKEFKERSLNVLSHDGSGFLAWDGTIVFVVRTMKESQSGFAIIRVKETGEKIEMDWTYIEAAENCYSSFLNWNRKIIMVPRSCWGFRGNVLESIDLGKTWKDTDGSISRLWDYLQDGADFITVIIEGKTVLLFTELRNKDDVSKGKHEIRLRFADGNRVHDVGPAITGVNLIAFSGLFYANGELFFLHQQLGNGPQSIFLTPLDHQLEIIKFVIKTWGANDEYLSRPCDETAPQHASSDTFCVTPMPTNGLVGFLSDRGNATHWHDEYFFMSARVKGGTKIKNGFTFRGANSGAQWLLAQRGRSQVYNFGRDGLTVVARVFLHDLPGSDRPLLTLGGVRDNGRLGLWYGRDKQWKITSESCVVTASVGNWEANKSYKVALALHSSTISLYIDGKPVGGPLRISVPEKELLNIEHIFIGGYEGDNVKDANSYVTVSNVFLYNALLDAFEVEVLSRKIVDSVMPTLRVKRSAC